MSRRLALAAIFFWALAVPLVAGAADNSGYKTAGGLAVYLGVLPAAMIQGHQNHPEEAMHGGVPRGRHAFHVMAAVFEAASGARIEDAKVSARVTPLGLGGVTSALEPMEIAGTVTYGNYFTMSGDGPYRIELSITPAGASRPVMLGFSYEHGTR
ncbi:MAG TPA: hypothetical protein VJA26_04075 [Gammaproteobacteria bacterium]|nr:hypothetical protein [Gammaproteobacteria bacterium]